MMEALFSIVSNNGFDVSALLGILSLRSRMSMFLHPWNFIYLILICYLNFYNKIVLKLLFNLYAGMTGIVEYTNYEDMKYAVSFLNMYLLLVVIRFI